MNKEQAIQTVAQALSTVRATQQEHAVINQAVQYLNTLVEPEVVEKPEDANKD